MLSVAEARQALLEQLESVDTTLVTIEEGVERVLAEEILSDQDLPPFSNSSMDGFAVREADVKRASSHAPVLLEVVGDIPAGHFPTRPVNPGESMRIMTGAAVPQGADAVVPVENTDFPNRAAGTGAPEKVRVFSPVDAGAYVRRQGEDLRTGEMVLSPGIRLRPQEIAMLATLGRSTFSAYRRPRVALLSTGDELLPVGADLAPGKIRESNSYALAGQIRSCGGVPLGLGIAGDKIEEIRAHLDRAVESRVDLLISSAGVSVGAFDYVRELLEAQGELHFWRVNMRPGKPLVFGRYQNVPFVGLPGNPVSTFIGFEVFLRPALKKLGGEKRWLRRTQRGILAETVKSDGRESYLRGIADYELDQIRVKTTGHQGSGNLYSLVLANVLFRIPAGVHSLELGSEVEFWEI